MTAAEAQARAIQRQFRNNTRLRIAPITSRTVSAAGVAVEAVEIPKVGFLQAVVLRYSGTITISSGSLADSGFNALKRIRISLNQGSDDLVDISGYGLQTMQPHICKGNRADLAGSGSTTVDADIYTIPTANGTASAFTITYRIPINLNDGDDFELGLINLQATDLRARIRVDAGSNTDWGTGYTWVTGTVDYFYEYYEVPNPSEVDFPPVNVVIRTLEETTSLTGAGDNIYELPRQGGLLYLQHTVKPNATRNNTDVSNFKIRFNKTDTILDMSRYVMKQQMRQRYGVNYPTGSFAYDFHSAQGIVNQGNFRDLIDTEELTTTESIVTLASGVTLGSNNNTMDTVRRIIQTLKG